MTEPAETRFSRPTRNTRNEGQPRADDSSIVNMQELVADLESRMANHLNSIRNRYGDFLLRSGGEEGTAIIESIDEFLAELRNQSVDREKRMLDGEFTEINEKHRD